MIMRQRTRRSGSARKFRRLAQDCYRKRKKAVRSKIEGAFGKSENIERQLRDDAPTRAAQRTGCEHLGMRRAGSSSGVLRSHLVASRAQPCRIASGFMP